MSQRFIIAFQNEKAPAKQPGLFVCEHTGDSRY
jgi:hypothetical protein